MKTFKKLLGLYLIIGIIMAVHVSIIGNFALLTGTGGISIFEYVRFVGFLFGLCWLPYSINTIFSPYSEYFVFGESPVFLIIYISVFILLSLYIVIKKSKPKI